jgi:VanZ like family
MGLLFGLAYSRRWLLTICLVAAGAFSIEALQFLTPDRHPVLEDAFVKMGGGTIGILVGFAFQRRFL